MEICNIGYVLHSDPELKLGTATVMESPSISNRKGSEDIASRLAIKVLQVGSEFLKRANCVRACSRVEFVRYHFSVSHLGTVAFVSVNGLTSSRKPRERTVANLDHPRARLLSRSPEQ